MPDYLVGTSGWSYNEWKGLFYQKGEKRKLPAYSHVFKTVEIDSTFSRNPSKGTVMGWLKYSPSDFVFTAKMPKLITHDKHLGLKSDVKADLGTYFNLMRPLQLGGKLGCFLFQLPPKCECNLENLESFFGMLDPQFKYAIEFRDASWLKNETWDLLKKYEVTYTVVDESLLPPEVHLTANFTYFRWHGKGEKIWFDYRYSKEELDNWVPKVQETSKKMKKIYGFFNNHYHGYAPENCLNLPDKLGLLSETQKKLKISQRLSRRIWALFSANSLL